MNVEVKPGKSIKFEKQAIAKAGQEQFGQYLLLTMGSLISGFFIYFVGIQICRMVWPNMPDPGWWHMLLIPLVAGIVFVITYIASRNMEIKVPEKRLVVPVYDQSRSDIESVLVEQLSRIHLLVFSLVMLSGISSFFLIGLLLVWPAVVDKENLWAGNWMLFAACATMAVIGWLIYCVIKLFTLSPQFYVRGTALPLGSTSNLRWETNSGIGRLESLSLKLVGEELPWHSAGTGRVEAVNVFHTKTLLVTTDRTIIRSGSIQVCIPADSMHTLTASENQIRWQLRVRGEIPWLPMLKKEFEIPVSPNHLR